MHWLGPYIVKEIIVGGVVQLVKLNGELFQGKVNGILLKLYTGDPAPMQLLYDCGIVLVFHIATRKYGTTKYIVQKLKRKSEGAA